jgi:spore coat protein U-like protein
MKNKALTLIVSSLLVLAPAANAVTKTTSGDDKLTVSTAITSLCNISSTGAALLFDTYVPDAAVNIVKSDDITITCNGTPSYELFTDTAVNSRLMDGDADENNDQLAYSLYSDEATLAVLPIASGAGTVSGTIVSGTPNNTVNIWGAIDTGQYKKTGAYSQVISLIVSYN